MKLDPHDTYVARMYYYYKWRLCWKGKEDYVNTYLQRFSERESTPSFTFRQKITPPNLFATTQIIDIANSIYDRMGEIKRTSKSEKYMTAISGLFGGVDQKNTSMNHFIGLQVLRELLFMGKVGVFVDSPANVPLSYSDQRFVFPYMYPFAAEQIYDWEYGPDGKLSYLVLADYDYYYNELNQLLNRNNRFRVFEKTPNGVTFKLYKNNIDEKEVDGQNIEVSKTLSIGEIPFVIFEINDSLMANVADLQIALMNIESSDLNFIFKANFPFYVESFDPRVDALMTNVADDPSDLTNGSQANVQNKTPTNEITVGSINGRRFPISIDKFPEFIAPPTDSVKVSMEKQEQIKRDILLLLHKTTSGLKSTRSSEGSKAADVTREEQGLPQIGFELCRGENEILQHWLAYESKKPDRDDIVIYPSIYRLKDDSERIKEAKELYDLMKTVPSNRFRRVISKRTVDVLLTGKLPDNEIKLIHNEIDTAIIPVENDYKAIASDVMAGVLSPETACTLRGYPDGEHVKAAQAHAERAKRIAEAQASVSKDSKDGNHSENFDPTLNPEGKVETRGEGE